MWRSKRINLLKLAEDFFDSLPQFDSEKQKYLTWRISISSLALLMMEI